MRRYQRIAIISALVAGLTAAHYTTSPDSPALHLLYRELYLLPIFLAGWWLGLRGGLIASLAITVVYLPHMLMRWGSASAVDFLNLLGHSGHVNPIDVSNISEIVIFSVFGGLIGRYSDMRRRWATAIRTGESENGAAPPAASAKRLLLYLDESRASLRAAKYIAAHFGGSGAQVTLLTVYSEPRADFFAAPEELEDYRRQKQAALRGAMERARTILVAAGFAEADIVLKEAQATSEKSSDQILIEQQTEDYDTVIMGREHSTKAEEFLFGSVANRLVREARGAVLVVNPS